MTECERCGISEEDYGAEIGSYNGQDLCEECKDEVMEEEAKK